MAGTTSALAGTRLALLAVGTVQWAETRHHRRISATCRLTARAHLFGTTGTRLAETLWALVKATRTHPLAPAATTARCLLPAEVASTAICRTRGTRLRIIGAAGYRPVGRRTDGTAASHRAAPTATPGTAATAGILRRLVVSRTGATCPWRKSLKSRLSGGARQLDRKTISAEATSMTTRAKSQQSSHRHQYPLLMLLLPVPVQQQLTLLPRPCLLRTTASPLSLPAATSRTLRPRRLSSSRCTPAPRHCRLREWATPRLKCKRAPGMPPPLTHLLMPTHRLLPSALGTCPQRRTPAVQLR